MAGSGQYTVLVKGKLDDSKIRQQLESLGNKVNIGGKNGIGGISQSTNKTAAGVRKLNATLDSTNKKVKKVHTVASGLSRQKIKMSDQFKQMQKEVGKTNSKLTELGGTIKNRLAVSLLDRAIYGGVDAMGAMVNKVFDLDAALTEYRKVSNLSGKELEQYTADAYKMGRTVAKTGTEVIEASTSFKKMGYSDKESLQLAKVATTFQNIADTQITAGQSADFINSQMKAFNITANDAVSIIDSVNEVANNFAVGTGDLQGALTVASSSLKSAGNDFNQTIGLVTAATELMPGKAQTVGNAFRTVGINIAALAKKNDEWVAANGKVNVALKDSQGELRSTFDIMKDLYTGVDGQSEAWENLRREEKIAIGMVAGGKTRYQQFVAAMDNFSTAIEANETAQKAQGSATRENAKYLDSLQGHLQNLRSAFEELAYKTLSSDMLGKELEVLTKVVEFLSSDFGQLAIKATLAFTAINVLVKGATALKGLSMVKLIGEFGSIIKEGGSVATVLGNIGNAAAKSGSTTGKVFKEILTAITSITPATATVAAGVGLIGVAVYREATKLDRMKEKHQETVSQIQKNNEEINKLTSSSDGLTDKERDRLAVLREQTAELEKQARIEAQEIVSESFDKYGKKFDTNKGNIERAQKSYESSLKKYKDFMKNDFTGTKADWTTAQDLYDKVESSAKVVNKYTEQTRQSSDEIIKAHDKAVKSGIPLTEQEERAYKNAIKFKSEYASMKVDEPFDISKAKDMFANAEDIAKEEGGLEKLNQQYSAYYDSLLKGAKGEKTFKKYLDSAGESLKDVGEYNEKTGQFEFKTTDIKKFADAMGLTEDAAESLINSEAELGRVKFKFPEDQVKDFNKSLKKMDGTVTDTDGNLVMSASNMQEYADKLGIPQVALGDFQQALEKSGATIIDFSDTSKTGMTNALTTLSSFGSKSGVVVDSLGKLKSVNVNNLVASMKSLGASQDDLFNVVNYLKDLDGVELKGINLDEVFNDEGVKDKLSGIWDDAPTEKIFDIDANTSNAEDAINQIDQQTVKDKLVSVTGNIVAAVQAVDTVNKKKVSDKNVFIKAKDLASAVISKFSGVKTIGTRFIDIVERVKNKVKINNEDNAHGSRHVYPKFARGTSRVIPAQVNEQGFEIIQDGKTGLMRIADGGKRTNTMLGVGDAVYTHGQSMRMLQKVGITEASVLQGKVGDIILNGIQKLPGFKSGKKSKRKKQIEKLRDKFDKQVDILEWKRDYYNWSDETFNKAYTKLYKKYRTKLKKLKSTLTGDQKRDYKMSLREASMERGKEETESFIEGMVGTKDDLDKAEAMINKLRKAQKISAKEAAGYHKEAKQANLEYWEELYERGKKTYAELKTQLKTYYDQGVISAKEYYEKLANLAENEVDKKKEQFSTEYDFARAYVERQISLQEKENDLITAKSDLLTAQSQKVKVYKEGIGFVYQADEDAVREAEQNVKSYDNEWQKILDLMDEMEEVANLEELYEKGGKNVPLDVLGTDINAWQKWIEENQKNQLAYGSLSDMSGRDARQFLDEKGNIKDSKLGEFAFNTKSFVAPNLTPSTYSVADINQMRMATDIGKTSSAGVTNNYNFGDLSLPNVTDADTFVKELNNLQNKAIQVSADRG